MARSRTIWKNGKVYAEYEGDTLVYLAPEYSAPNRSDTIKAPYFIKDIGEYRSPIDGSVITTRSAHRDHMRAHDVYELGNDRTLAAPAPPSADRELGELIKRHLNEVKDVSQEAYDNHVHSQRAEHEAIGALAVADPV